MSIYCCSDLHGRYDIWRQIKSFLKPEDKLYYLGDAADRGPNGWKIIKELISDNRIIYIKGNHEDMLVKAMKEYIKYDGGYYKDLRLLCSNGGEKTFNDWVAEGARTEWIKILDSLPLVRVCGNVQCITIYLSHAGLTPWKGMEIFPSEYDLLWDRDHYLEDPKEEDLWGISIHGHTPIPYILEDLRINEFDGGALWYCCNHKICLDTGACFTGSAVLLDLDTFDQHIFEA